MPPIRPITRATITLHKNPDAAMGKTRTIVSLHQIRSTRPPAIEGGRTLGFGLHNFDSIAIKIIETCVIDKGKGANLRPQVVTDKSGPI